MNSDIKLNNATAEKALKKWRDNLPLNRAARRNQLNKYKYYLKLEVEYSQDTSTNGIGTAHGVIGGGENISSWTVYGVRKNGTKFMIDTLGHYKTRPLKKKEDEKAITAPIANNVEPKTNIDDEANISPLIPIIKPIENSHLILPSQAESEMI